MSGTTKIEWSEKVWNPVTGCDRVSPGCDHCYALGMAKRLKAMGRPEYQTDGDPRTSGPGFGVTCHEDRLTVPLHWRKPQKIFVNSMSDLFHEDVPDEFIARVWQVMGVTPEHTYQILTKRHGRMKSWATRWYAGEIEEPYAVAPVPGYPGYFITTHGEVLGKRRDTRDGLQQDAGERGHRRVTLYREGSPRSGEHELVHRLVLTAFVRKPRAGEQACHRNGDPADNRLSNLYWGTQQANWDDRLRHGNGRSYQKLTEDDVSCIRVRHADGESAYAIAKDYPVSDTQIKNIVTGKQWVNPTPDPVVRAPSRALLPGVWIGVTVESQQWADIRVPALLATPAVVRWVSAEPLLGPLDLTRLPFPRWSMDQKRCEGMVIDALGGRYGVPGQWQAPASSSLSWVVVGGESGPKARPMHPKWARGLRDQCVAAGVPYHFKQWGEWAPAPWKLSREPGESDDQYKARSDAVGATHAFTGGYYRVDGRDVEGFEALDHRPWSCERGPSTPGGAVGMRRVGKKSAGRELDGRTWDEYPEVAR